MTTGDTDETIVVEVKKMITIGTYILIRVPKDKPNRDGEALSRALYLAQKEHEKGESTSPESHWSESEGPWECQITNRGLRSTYGEVSL